MGRSYVRLEFPPTGENSLANRPTFSNPIKASNQSVLWRKKTTLSKTNMKSPSRRRSTSDRRILHRQAGRTPRLLARKVRPRRKKSHQNVLRQKERPSRPMKRSVSALTSFRNAGTDWRCLATRVPIGSKPGDSFSPKQVLAQVLAKVRPLTLIAGRLVLPRTPGNLVNRSYLKVWISGTHSLILSSSRFIAKGFAISPATPGSFNNACARSSSALPETRSNGGTIRGGSMLL